MHRSTDDLVDEYLSKANPSLPLKSTDGEESPSDDPEEALAGGDKQAITKLPPPSIHESSANLDAALSKISHLGEKGFRSLHPGTQKELLDAGFIDASGYLTARGHQEASQYFAQHAGNPKLGPEAQQHASMRQQAHGEAAAQGAGAHDHWKTKQTEMKGGTPGQPAMAPPGQPGVPPNSMGKGPGLPPGASPQVGSPPMPTPGNAQHQGAPNGAALANAAGAKVPVSLSAPNQAPANLPPNEGAPTARGMVGKPPMAPGKPGQEKQPPHAVQPQKPGMPAQPMPPAGQPGVPPKKPVPPQFQKSMTGLDSLGDYLEKAMGGGHKYIKREGTPGYYKYTYAMTDRGDNSQSSEQHRSEAEYHANSAHNVAQHVPNSDMIRYHEHMAAGHEHMLEGRGHLAVGNTVGAVPHLASAEKEFNAAHRVGGKTGPVGGAKAEASKWATAAKQAHAIQSGASDTLTYKKATPGEMAHVNEHMTIHKLFPDLYIATIAKENGKFEDFNAKTEAEAINAGLEGQGKPGAKKPAGKQVAPDTHKLVVHLKELRDKGQDTIAISKLAENLGLDDKRTIRAIEDLGYDTEPGPEGRELVFDRPAKGVAAVNQAREAMQGFARYSKVTKYTNAIKNPDKRTYAQAYAKWMSEGERTGSEPEVPKGLGTMGAQGVRMHLANLKDEAIAPVQTDEALKQVAKQAATRPEATNHSQAAIDHGMASKKAHETWQRLTLDGKARTDPEVLAASSKAQHHAAMQDYHLGMKFANETDDPKEKAAHKEFATKRQLAANSHAADMDVQDDLRSRQVEKPAAAKATGGSAGEKYQTALKHDKAWSEELQRQFGKQAGDKRYTKEGMGEPGSKLRQLHDQAMASTSAWQQHMKTGSAPTSGIMPTFPTGSGTGVTAEGAKQIKADREKRLAEAKEIIARGDKKDADRSGGHGPGTFSVHKRTPNEIGAVSAGPGSMHGFKTRAEAEAHAADWRARMPGGRTEIEEHGSTKKPAKPVQGDLFKKSGITELGDYLRKSAEQIPGGLAAGKPDSDFNAKALAQGAKVEMEHTNNKKVAVEIAKDHLTEDPHYYTKLAKMEKSDKVGTAIASLLQSNPKPEDAEVHALAGKLGMPVDDLEERIYAMAGKAKQMEKCVMQKSGLRELGDYLSKADGMPDQNDWDDMDKPAEQTLGESANGGDLTEHGSTPGNGTSGPGDGQDQQGQLTGVPEGQHETLGDDRDPAKQMAPGTAALGEELPEGYKSLTPAAQREMVAKENAQKISELNKSQDVHVGAMHPLSTQAIHGNTDIEAEALLKSDFYHGASPTLAHPGSILRQSVLCKSEGCGCSYPAMLTSCPSCGGGITKSRLLPHGAYMGGGDAVILEKSAYEPILRPAPVEDDVCIAGPSPVMLRRR